MVQSQQKLVAMPENRARIPAEVSDRDLWIEFRRSLLQQLAAIERKLNISHQRCEHCKNITE